MKEFNHMEAIEQEKAKFLEMNKAICDEVGMSEMWSSTKELVSTSFDKGAQVAEKIARADERERCIKAAQDWYCKDRCAGYNACKAKYQGKCSMTENVREQIMKGVSNEENHV